MRHNFNKFNITHFIILLFFCILFIGCPVQGGGSGGGGGDDNHGSSLSVTQIATGVSHTVALLSDGTVKCWGRNNYGQLGYGDTEDRGDEPGEMGENLPTVDLGAGRTAVQIAAGDYHTVVILDNGYIKCWGYNFFGQLGRGNTENQGDEPDEMGDNIPILGLGIGRTAVQIAAGYGHTVVLLDDGSVKCWGYNSLGQLGYGDRTWRGDDPGEMGINLDPVDLGTGRTAIQIAACNEHTVVLLDNGTVKCWGRNNSGQLGYGDTEHRGDDPGEMGDNLPFVDLHTGFPFHGIGAGRGFTYAFRNYPDHIDCWGYNESGQLGIENTENRGDEANEMGVNLIVTSLDSTRYPIMLNGGLWHVAAILNDGTVKCWGRSDWGTCGYGNSGHIGDEPGEMGDNLPTVDLGTGRTAIQITGGEYHTVVLLDNGTVKGWGGNNYGQLGYGDTSTRNTLVEMGDNLPAVEIF